MGKCRTKTESITVESDVYQRTLKQEGETVLTLSLRSPRLPEDSPALRRIGRYYQHASACCRMRWETMLYTQACAELEALRKRSLPFRPWEVAADFTVTYNEKCLFSLYTDFYEYTGGAHGNTMRCGDTWDLNTGIPCPLASFYSPRSRWKRQSIAAVRSIIAHRLSTGEYLYLEGWETAAAAQFDPCRFYLTQEGVTLFYPLYSLAPYVEGIPTFILIKWEPCESA